MLRLMTWWKKIRSLQNQLSYTEGKLRGTEDLQKETLERYNKLQDEYTKLEGRHKEILKRQPNIEQLILALRDLETGSAMIKISRVDADQLFMWNPNR